jgi:hypothetical protein
VAAVPYAAPSLQPAALRACCSRRHAILISPEREADLGKQTFQQVRLPEQLRLPLRRRFSLILAVLAWEFLHLWVLHSHN